MEKPTNFEEYILNYPLEVRILLIELNDIIIKAAPKAEPVISYGMPAFKLNGILLYFAAHTKHIGFYPLASAINEFKKEISEYKTSKGSIQFPFENKLPKKLITQIVKFRVLENQQRAEAKKNKKKK